jgi:DNA modification methylase
MRGNTSTLLFPEMVQSEPIAMTPDQVDTPTVPLSVSSETPLDTLNLSWSEKDLPEKERTKHVHRLHPYLGKFIPQLAEIFLRKYFKPGDTILDPFCGSGTTLIQANELGIHSIGYDISGFNVMLCRVKSQRYNTERLRREVLDILQRTERSFQKQTTQASLWSVPEIAELPDTTDNDYLKAWFAPSALRELLIFRASISSYQYQDFLKIVLSRAARSARLTTHFDLDFPKKPQTAPYWCYKHSRTCAPTSDAMQFLRRYALDSVKRVEAFAGIRTTAKVSVKHADSRKAKFPPLDGVLTSPPYVGLIDYHNQHAYAYHLLGLRDRSAHEIGPASQGSGRQARERYQMDIAEVFRRTAKALPNGGHIIVVAADRDDLYPQIAELAGLETEAIVNRHVNRRTGRRSNEFYESVFIWRKP